MSLMDVNPLVAIPDSASTYKWKETVPFALIAIFFSLVATLSLVVLVCSVFVGRTSLMFRGMGSAIGSGQIRTATRWHKHAEV